MAKQGILLTDAQVAALERKQDDDLAHGEIETAHPGYRIQQLATQKHPILVQQKRLEKVATTHAEYFGAVPNSGNQRRFS